MTTHEMHMKLIDDVNNAKTQCEHEIAYWTLHGWRKGVEFAGGTVDLINADLEQFERGHESRLMCCGVFNEWKPLTETKP